MNIIKFYGRRLPFFEFSNFYKAQLYIDGRLWRTSEHYYQAMKFEGSLDHMLDVQNATTPGDAAKIGRDKNRPVREDWAEVKDDVMYKVLKAKFTQHLKLRKLLVETGDAILVEHTKNDTYWADGGDGSGKNMLGNLLVKLRDELNAS